jgi:hypothetical protein
LEGIFSIFNSGSNIYLGASSAVYKSPDNGSNWIKYTNGMPSSVKVQSIYATGNSVLAGFTASVQNYGVYLSTNSGEDWAGFNEGFPNGRTINTMLEYDQYVYAAIAAGLFQNGGVYRRPLSNLITSIENSEINLREFSLEQNYPNPFNPSTKIKFTIPSAPLSLGEGLGVRLIVYDALGDEVAVLVDEYKPAGSYEVTFDVKELSSGIYFYTLQAGSFVETRKMLMIK